MPSHSTTADWSPTVQINITNLIDNVQCYQTVRELRWPEWRGSYTGATPPTISAGMRRISLSGTSTIYLIGYATFTVSTMTAYGFIGARRVR